MQPFDFETIRPLIASQTVHTDRVEVIFLCPQSGKTVNAQAELQGQGWAHSPMAQEMRRSAARSLRGPLAAAVRSLFGRGTTVARLAGDVASSATYSATQPLTKSEPGGDRSEQRLQEGVVAAFRSVATSFQWDASKSTWVAAC